MLLNQATPCEQNNIKKSTWKSRLPRSFKILSYSVICFFVLVPLAFIGFFQQTHLAQETIDELSLSLSTLAHEANETEVSPELAVAWMSGHKLVQWTTYFKQGKVFGQAGLPPRFAEADRVQNIFLQTDQPFRKQFPTPRFLMRPQSIYRFILPIQKNQDRLEVGVSYESLFSAARDTLMLSGALFFLAFIFFLVAVLFVDAYVSSFTRRVIRTIRSPSRTKIVPQAELGISQHFSPTYNALMEALEYREGQVIDTRETLETVFNGLQSGVAMISTEMQIVLVNQFYQSLVSSSTQTDTLVGNPCLRLNLPEQNPTVETLCANTLRSLDFQTQEVRVGSDRYFSQEAYPLFDSNNQPVAIIVQTRDITAEKKSHETIQSFNDELRWQLAEQKKQIEDAQQKILHAARLAAVGELAGGVAHEINNPNGLILAGSRYVLNRIQHENELPEYISKYLQRISKQSERVAQIVSALLTFSRRRPFDKEPLQIERAIDEAFELAEVRVGHGKVLINKKVQANLPLIDGNLNQLTQVFLNLFNNSVDAMPDGGELHVSAAVQPGKPTDVLEIKVRDTGTGINQEILKKVLEPFFTTKPLGKGTGLGLSVSHGIIEEHGGTLNAGNHPDGGAEFELTFPLRVKHE